MPKETDNSLRYKVEELRAFGISFRIKNTIKPEKSKGNSNSSFSGIRTLFFGERQIKSPNRRP
jgi:hypothetical protein